MRPGEKGTFTSCPAFFAAASTAAQPPRTIRSASETFLPPDCAALNSFWIACERLEHLRQLRRLVDFPILLRRQANARPVRPTALVGAAERRRRRPGRRDQLGDRQSGCEDLGLQSGNVLLPDQWMIDRGNRVLPQQRLFGNQRAEVPRDRPHVAVRQLEPGLGERVRELIGILEEAP